MMKLIGRSNKVGHLSAPDRQTDRQMLCLDAGQCFADSFGALKKHPFLFAGASLITVLLGVASGMLLIGSLYAGLSVMLLKAMEGKKLALGDLFEKINQFPGLFLIVVFGLFAILTGTVIALAPFVLGNWHPILLDGQTPYLDRFNNLIVELKHVSWGFRLAFFSLATGIFYLLVPRIFAGVRCFHMLLLSADQNFPADEAYVISKKAVKQYGFKQHVLLTLIVLWIVVLSAEVFVGLVKPFTGFVGVGLFFVFMQPVLLGLLASAYRQTLQVEAHQHEVREEKVIEMEDELKTARDMQMSLLPATTPDVAGYEVGDICIPANAVCGDYYSYRWLDDRYFALIAADVSGKAMKAAVTAVRFNEMLRYECKGRTDAAEILAGLDASLEDQIDITTFVTCCVVVLDTQTHTIEIANAGHCEPCIFSQHKQQTEVISLTGFPLGLARSLRGEGGYEKVCVKLEPGDTLVLYSDGVVEAFNDAGDLYEDERLVQLLNRAGKHLEPMGIIDRVVQDVERHMGGREQSDDISLIALKRQGEMNGGSQNYGEKEGVHLIEALRCE